ncbi:MAG TPA: acetyl-CoA carboxylase biotin carboxyl carrier protein [Candidatus Acidoferrales bacterium]|nr:acetyl-CoA carboxylase biotin carboxyl carrier protein [Candidatus Acidoferrales bacterium]
MPLRKKVANHSGGLPGLDLAEIERLLAFMEKHNLEQFEYALGDLRIALKRAGSGIPIAYAAAPASSQVAHRAGAGAPTAAAPEEALAKSAPSPTSEEHVIKSPIVGTFYASPSPDAPAFVKPGDKVAKGQVVCIVEAMKLMNEIEADVAGEVVRMLVENGSPVEYGQPLFAIRANGKK